MKKIELNLAIISILITVGHAQIELKELSGNANLFYDTNDNDNTLFDKKQSMGNLGVNFSGILKLNNSNSKLNFGVSGVSTLGLENSIANNTWVDQTDYKDAIWLDTLNLTITPFENISNTTLILGRQEFATPLLHTETWNVVKNTYDAFTLINRDLKDTTLTTTWIGRSNSYGDSVVKARNIGDGFDSFLTKEGVYIAGIDTKLTSTLDTQAWYYIAPNIAKVLWIQAESKINQFTFGGQFGDYNPQDSNGGIGFGFKIDYDFENLGLMVAYSSVKKGGLFINLGAYQTPLYTMGWWNSNAQGQSNTDAFNLTAEYSIEDFVNLGLFFTSWSGDNRTNEIALSTNKSIGALDATIAYIYTDVDSVNNVQAYLSYSF